jgi:hypothetical protein
MEYHMNDFVVIIPRLVLPTLTFSTWSLVMIYVSLLSFGSCAYFKVQYHI